MNKDYNLKEVVLAAFEQFMTIEESDAEKRPAPGKWSAKEIIGHLIDSAANNQGRFVRAQNSNDLIGVGYNQDEWVTAQNYQGENWHDFFGRPFSRSRTLFSIRFFYGHKLLKCS